MRYAAVRSNFALAALLAGCGSGSSTQPDAALDDTKGVPAGIRTVVPWPTQGQMQHMSMALDENGDPLLSWMNTQLPDRSSTVWFARWDRKTATLSQPVQVASTNGTIEENDPFRETSIAYDTSTKAIGIAYQADRLPDPNSNYEVRLALSTDGGKTFTTQGVSEHTSSNNEDASDGALAMHNGAIHLAYVQKWQVCSVGMCYSGYYATRAAGASTFTRTALPVPPGKDDIRYAPIDLALDAQGNPAVVYFARGAAYDVSVVYYRPGAAPTIAADSAGIQNDVVSQSLVFDGMAPRIAFHLKAQTDAPYDMRFASSANGTAWDVRPLPREGSDTTARFQSISVGHGGTAIAAEFGSSLAKQVCGGPKLLRSADGQSFTVCGPDAATVPSFAGRYVVVRHRPDGKLVLAFVYTPTDNTKLPRGLVLWREP